MHLPTRTVHIDATRFPTVESTDQRESKRDSQLRNAARKINDELRRRHQNEITMLCTDILERSEDIGLRMRAERLLSWGDRS